MFGENKVDLVYKAKRGNGRAFTKLIEVNLKSIYRVAKGILKNEEDIEDAIQNTILNAFSNIKTLRKEELFKTWLIKILINECNKIYNFNKKCIYLETVIEEQYNDKYENLDLKIAVDSLPEELRLVITLFYFEDLKMSQIAEVVGIPEGTVKSRLSRAKDKIAKSINGKEIM
ncbi:sigma-70 family RNA polymerase sigma factor [Clostridium sp. AL.422]|uniref:RNA polymerase sigma factor n=1 Tax=Clostridium TaxID=1485 RepID=UPI00293DF560|nr:MULTISPECIES: sigma-70 family RNA polymerase sigma factor [unclassified Clostridium]MDV4149854.1 sigma-70 family RNA polymerase sigma factor [Clostridium sp. AL.422]